MAQPEAYKALCYRCRLADDITAVASLGDDAHSEIDEIVGMLTGNLAKIAEHGWRADGIVKSMLAHSRAGSGERQTVDINSLVDESLNLAYHGARAQDQNFNITLERDLDRSIVPARAGAAGYYSGVFEPVRQRLLRRKQSLQRPARPQAQADDARSRRRGRDPGTRQRRRHSPEVKEKLFQPFFTTKPTGEGTGLGLSISYDIITQQHRGTITVESEQGAFTEFTVRLPRY